MNSLKLVDKALIGEISQDDASKMVYAYNNTDSPKNTKSVWFSLEQMDQLVTLLKAEKLVGLDTDGVRIYSGTYTDETIGAQPKAYLGRDTVIFVSTKAFRDTDTGEVLYHEDYFEHLELPKYGNPENNGELCPSHCDGTTLPKP